MSACMGRARHSQAVPQSQGLPWLKHGWPKSAPAVHFFVPSVHPPGLPLAAGKLRAQPVRANRYRLRRWSSSMNSCGTSLWCRQAHGGPAPGSQPGYLCKPIWCALRLLVSKHSCRLWCHNSCCGGGLGALAEHGCSSACYSRRCLATQAACGPNCLACIGREPGGSVACSDACCVGWHSRSGVTGSV